MSDVDFLDTNVLVYAYDSRFPEKQRVAQQLILNALAGEATTSAQVLGEFATTLLHKFSAGPSPAQLLDILDVLAPIKITHIGAETIRRAVEAHQKYNLHFYDGMIVAAAESAGCGRILSEDFNSGQKYFDLIAVNPFA